MTPQQANELLAALERIATPDSGDHSPSKVARDAIADWNRRAPAPTEPAVDRDSARLVKAAMAVMETYGFLDALQDEASQWFTDILDAEFCKALATPASPAVPAKPLHQVIAEWDAMPYAKAPAVPELRLCPTPEELKAHLAAVQAVPAPAPQWKWACFEDWLASPIMYPGSQLEYVRVAFNSGRAQASQPTSTPEAVNLLVEEAKRVIGKN